LYITPSRSLAHQVSGDLRRHLNDSGITVRTVVAGAEQAVLLNEELDVLAQRRSVTVTTPEKCDAYYRNAKDLFGTCALVIFDEVHKIGDKDRRAAGEFNYPLRDSATAHAPATAQRVALKS
jgi:replicative superfamily II helicase